jgi:hypothetical protein
MKIHVILALLVLVLVSSPVYAMTFDISPKTQKTELDRPVNFVFTVENEQNYVDDMKFIVTGPNMGWLKGYPDTVRLQGGEARAFNVTVSPTGGIRGVFEYNVTVISSKFPDTNVKKNFTLNVLYPLNIASLQVNKMDGQIEVVTDLQAVGRQAATIFFKVLDSQGKTVSDFSYDVEVTESQRMTRYIDIRELYAGDYKLVASIPETKLSKETYFTVESIRSITETKKVTSNPFYTVVEVTIDNQGNTIEKNYEYYQEVPSDTFTGFITAPSNCDTENDQTKCKYVISEIKPGMNAQIIYRVDMWPLFGGYALGVVGVIGSAGFVYKRTTNLKFRKRYMKKGENNYTVFLNIKNKFKKGVDNIIVRDWVSPLAEVVNEFDSVKPVIRKSDAGTELIWKLDKFDSKEDRIISYRINTIVNGGGLKMPKAYIRYNNRKGERCRIYSNQITID